MLELAAAEPVHPAIPIGDQRIGGSGPAKQLLGAPEQMKEQPLGMDTLLGNQFAMIIAADDRAVERALDRSATGRKSSVAAGTAAGGSASWVRCGSI